MKIRSLHIKLPPLWRIHKVVDKRPKETAVDIMIWEILSFRFTWYVTRKGHDGKAIKCAKLRIFK